MTNLTTYPDLISETTAGLTSINSFGNNPEAITSFETDGFEILNQENVKLTFKMDLSGKAIYKKITVNKNNSNNHINNNEN